jgi:c-di-AMP phosphodiesterase-like protein
MKTKTLINSVYVIAVVFIIVGSACKVLHFSFGSVLAPIGVFVGMSALIIDNSIKAKRIKQLEQDQTVESKNSESNNS